MVARGEIVWTPNDRQASKTRLFEFANGAGFDELHKWSVDSPDEFWRKIWQFCGVVGEQGERAIHKTAIPNDPSAEFIAMQFFPDAKLSVVENFLKRSDSGEALVAIDETGKRISRSWDELRERVASLASALQSLGVVEGDRVVAWLPNAIEVVETMLASASIGAIFSSCSPDFGAQGVLDRFSQITPKVLVATESYIYGGKKFDCLERLAVVRKGLPSLKATLLVTQDANLVPHELVDYESCLKSGASTPVAPR
ncbi:MAG: AMP-binding protein, partial [Acidimicrobiaceae bacterium]